MKKTLIALFALCGVAGAAITVSESTGTTTTTGGVSYFNFTLDNDSWLQSSQPLLPEVKLQSLDIETFATWYQMGSGVGVAIFKTTSETTSETTTTTTKTLTYVGGSEWLSSGTAGQTVTFTFADQGLALNSATQYTAVFYGHKDSFDSLSSVSTLTLTNDVLLGVQRPSQNSPIVNLGLKLNTGVSGDGLSKGTGSTTNGYYTDNTPIVTFKVVPEPATATLSLLALCGLCARRRRK